MPAATTKADLLAVTAREYDKLSALIADLDADLAMRPFEDGWSIKDVLAHRAHWIDLFLGWYHDGQAGKEVAFPAPGYKWNQLKAYNAAQRAAQTDLSWNAARVALDIAHDRLRQFLENLDDDALYGGPMKGANNAWTTGRWAEAAGPSHYRSAAKFVRACKRVDIS